MDEAGLHGGGGEPGRATLNCSPPGKYEPTQQPHLFTRTREFASEFGAALSAADESWVTDVYPAREEPIPGGSGELIAESVRRAGEESVTYHPGLEDLPQAVAKALRAGDVCLTLGAGSIEDVGALLLGALGVGRDG